MVLHHHVEGYENFMNLIKEFKSEEAIVVYFSGTKEESTGDSWCDDCQRAWPVISKLLEETKPNFHFVYVEVGDRLKWKDPNCPFRKDASTNLMVLPTLIRWNTPKRLSGDQCEKEELIELLLAEDDDDD